MAKQSANAGRLFGPAFAAAAQLKQEKGIAEKQLELRRQAEVARNKIELAQWEMQRIRTEAVLKDIDRAAIEAPTMTAFQNSLQSAATIDEMSALTIPAGLTGERLNQAVDMLNQKRLTLTAKENQRLRQLELNQRIANQNDMMEWRLSRDDVTRNMIDNEVKAVMKYVEPGNPSTLHDAESRIDEIHKKYGWIPGKGRLTPIQQPEPGIGQTNPLQPPAPVIEPVIQPSQPAPWSPEEFDEFLKRKNR